MKKRLFERRPCGRGRGEAIAWRVSADGLRLVGDPPSQGWSGRNPGPPGEVTQAATCSAVRGGPSWSAKVRGESPRACCFVREDLIARVMVRDLEILDRPQPQELGT